MAGNNSHCLRIAMIDERTAMISHICSDKYAQSHTTIYIISYGYYVMAYENNIHRCWRYSTNLQ